MQKLLIVSLVSTALLVGCGSESTSSDGTNGTGYTCTQQTIDDYNNVNRICGNPQNQADLRNCRSSADSFLGKYPNLSCTALNSTTNRTIQVYGSRIKSLRDIADRGIVDLNETNGGLCSRETIENYNKVNQTCTTAYNRSSLNNCREDVSAFLDRYPVLNCKAESVSTGANMYITHAQVQTLLESAENKITVVASCSLDVITDYNNVIDACANAYTQAEWIVCRDTADTFIINNPDMTCSATKQRSNEEIIVKTEDIREKRDQAVRNIN